MKQISNKVRAWHEMHRLPKTAKLRITVTMRNGESSSQEVDVKYNRLQTTALNNYQVSTLKKSGRIEYMDHLGTKVVYELTSIGYGTIREASGLPPVSEGSELSSPSAAESTSDLNSGPLLAPPAAEEVNLSDIPDTQTLQDQTKEAK